jgi:hypothetical protein
MEEVITKSLVGTGGFFATLSLAPISEVVSLMVGLATLVYMVVSIIKITKGTNQVMVEINDSTNITIPIRNLLALILAVAVSVTGYVNLISRITHLEQTQHIKDMEIRMNSEFRIKWPRGELGSLPDDAEQNLRLTYAESHLKEISNVVRKLQVKEGITE